MKSEKVAREWRMSCINKWHHYLLDSHKWHHNCITMSRINLIRNPLSARNPGVSHRQFETPPPSTVKCCLAMLLETYVGDCLSTCWAPAVCPAVNKCIASLSPLPLPPLLGHQHSKAHPSIVYTMSVLPQLRHPPHRSGSLHWRPRVALGHCLCTSESWVQQKSLPLTCLVCAFQQSRRPLHVHIEVMGVTWMQRALPLACLACACTCN